MEQHLLSSYPVRVYYMQVGGRATPSVMKAIAEGPYPLMWLLLIPVKTLSGAGIYIYIG